MVAVLPKVRISKMENFSIEQLNCLNNLFEVWQFSNTLVDFFFLGETTTILF